MRRPSGQAARHVARHAARHTGRALHWLCTVVLLLAVLLCAGVAVLSWRLAQGPLDAPWLVRRLEATANASGGPTRLTIGSAALAWQGFSQGVNMPLEIRLTRIAAADAAGTQIADIPQAELSLSMGALLLGRLRPRSIELDHARFRVLRAADGTFSLDLGSLTETDDTPAPERADEAGPPLLPGLVSELANPAATDWHFRQPSLIGQLRRIRVRGAAVVVVDRQLGATWRVPVADIDLDRLAGGGVHGTANAELALADQRTTIALVATLEPGGTRTRVEVTMADVQPAGLARAAPGLAPLAALAAPVSLTASLDLGPRLQPNDLQVDVKIGAGHAKLGANTIALDGATLSAQGNAEKAALRSFHLVVRPRDGAAPSTLQATGTLARAGDKLRASVTLALDQVGFADLATLWPEGAGEGARRWVTQNITAGLAREAHVAATIMATPDLSALDLASASGSIIGEGLTVHWLRPIPPIERAQAKLQILDPDNIEILVSSGQQRSEPPQAREGGAREGGAHDGAPLTIRGGRIKVSGIDHADQTAAIEAEIAGGLGEAVALLRNPRLKLLDKHPLPFKNVSGDASVKLNVQLPLEDKVRIEDIAIHAVASMDDVRATNILAGRDLDAAALDLDATAEGMKLTGQGQLAGIDTELAVDMDFRTGPPSQIVQKVSASGRATAAQMRQAGVDPGPLTGGSAGISASLTERRDGRGVLQADADLTAAEVSAAPLGWHKPAGSPAKLAAHVTLDHGRIVAVDSLTAEGADLSLHGRAVYGDGNISTLELDRVVIGRTSGQGSVRFGQPIRAKFTGAQIDLSAALSRHGGSSAASEPPRQGPAWSIEARFDRGLMANGGVFSGLAATAENDGRLFSRVLVDGQTGPGRPFRLAIDPAAGGRRLRADAADAGALFRGLDLVGTMQGGKLSVVGVYDDRRADTPLSGTAEITDFRVRDPNGLGKLLQAMTLYGLVQAASGPGLGFDRLTAPFTLTDDALDLGESRAVNPSLGVTAKGRLDLRRNTVDLQGTIVPAYFFNSLLGNIPLLGRVFSPEKGGGLFAASYSVRGPSGDPKVAVNPLSALTPGFLRGLFGIF